MDPGTVAAVGAGANAILGLAGGKESKRQANKALDAQKEQFDWVKSLFERRKGDIANVSKWASEQGLDSPDAMFARIDKATATQRSRDVKNLVNALFKQGGFREGETAAMNVLARSEAAHAEQRDKDYLSMAVDAFGRRLTLATAPYDTSLVGQTVAAGSQAAAAQADQANRTYASTMGSLGGLADAWSKYEAYRSAKPNDAQNRMQPVSTVTSQMGDASSMGALPAPVGSAGAFG